MNEPSAEIRPDATYLASERTLLMKNIDGLDKITPSAGIFGDFPG